MDNTELLKTLQHIHTQTLRRFKYVPDIHKWHTNERWPSPNELPPIGTFEGDCDDFALMCRKLCKEQQLPTRLVFCRVEDKKSYHLVCECYGFILDNRCASIQKIATLAYEWLYISGYEKGEPWHFVTTN